MIRCDKKIVFWRVFWNFPLILAIFKFLIKILKIWSKNPILTQKYQKITLDALFWISNCSILGLMVWLCSWSLNTYEKMIFLWKKSKKSKIFGFLGFFSPKFQNFDLLGGPCDPPGGPTQKKNLIFFFEKSFIRGYFNKKHA